MPKEMKLGAPTLRVRELKETLAFYESDLGLKVKAEYKDAEGTRVYELGVQTSSEPILIIKHDRKATLPPNDFAGLYHYAVLVPRKSLASTYLALRNSGVSFDGFADHSVSEALYLHDAEYNGIEIYADRPREAWARFFASSGKRADDLRRFVSLNKALDFESLLREVTKDERSNPARFPDGASIGHMHLRVTNLERSVVFYHETLGLDIVANYPEIGAAFLSVGGYHHHIGLNTWNSLGGSSHEGREAGLDKFTMIVPNTQVLKQLELSLKACSSKFERSADDLITTDPDGISLEFRAAK